MRGGGVEVHSNMWSSLSSCFLCSVVSTLKAGSEASKYLLILWFLSVVTFLISEQLLGAYVVVRDWPFCYYRLSPMTFLLFEVPPACLVLNPGPHAWGTLPPSYLPSLLTFSLQIGFTMLLRPWTDSAAQAGLEVLTLCLSLPRFRVAYSNISITSVDPCGYALNRRHIARSRLPWATLQDLVSKQ